MGSIVRRARSTGKTYQEAYKNLQKEEVYEKGHDIYNGGFNHVDTLLKEVTKLPDDIEKYHAVGVCIRKPKLNTNKIKSEVTNFPCKGTREWVTEYYATPSWRMNSLSQEIKSESQTECIRKAREYVEKNPGVSLEIHIRKVLKNMPSKVAEIKYKAASDEQDGEWEFLGSCPY